MRGREEPLPCGRKACAERNGNMDKLIEKLETSVENGAEVIVLLRMQSCQTDLSTVHLWLPRNVCQAS